MFTDQLLNMQLASSLQIAYSFGQLSLRECLLTSVVVSPECQRYFCFALLPKLNKSSAVRVLKQSVQKSYFSELFFAVLQRYPGLVDSQKIQRLVPFIRPQTGSFAIKVLRMFPSLIGQKNRWYKFLTRAPALIN